MRIARLFTDHPASVGESYFEHLAFATRFGLTMIGGGLACLVHAVLPFACVTRGSETVARLNETLARARASRVAAGAPAGGPMR
jgi:hypothetical protein